MFRRLLVRIGAACLLSWAGAASAAINVKVDYTYDTNSFFAPGSQARATIEAVASYYSNILDDTFSAISTPAPFTSSLPPNQNPGTVTWHWTMLFDNPSAAGQVTITDPNLSANEYRLFVGAKNLTGNELGKGGPGGRGWSSTPTPANGNFTQSEFNQVTAITNEFKSDVETRGEPSGFSAWGGAVSFDNDASTNWNFDGNTLPAAGKSDFLSVAFHEIGHALGLGTANAWNDLTAGSGNSAFFSGQMAVAEHGGTVPLAFNVIGGSPVADKGHWREGTMSKVFGTSISQEALMDPTITVGTRKRLTALDAAALTDIGWSVGSPPVLAGDFNGDNVVDAADYTVWRNGLGGTFTPAQYTVWKSNFGHTAGSGAGAGSSAAAPEPAALVLALSAFVLTYVLARRTK